jgi:hypothetical protein
LFCEGRHQFRVEHNFGAGTGPGLPCSTRTLSSGLPRPLCGILEVSREISSRTPGKKKMAERKRALPVVLISGGRMLSLSASLPKSRMSPCSRPSTRENPDNGEVKNLKNPTYTISRFSTVSADMIAERCHDTYFTEEWTRKRFPEAADLYGRLTGWWGNWTFFVPAILSSLRE